MLGADGHPVDLELRDAAGVGLPSTRIEPFPAAWPAEIDPLTLDCDAGEVGVVGQVYDADRAGCPYPVLLGSAGAAVAA